MKRRPYNSYEDYIAHQKSKLAKPGVVEGLLSIRQARIDAFAGIFRKFLPKDFRKKGGRALCAGARLGEEVEALNSVGFSAIGVDVNEYPPLVVLGDFNRRLPFDDAEFSLVFSNSVDHVFELESWAKEMQRLVRPRGRIMLQLMLGEMGGFESMQIDSPNEIIDLCPGFSVLVNESFLTVCYNHVLVLERNI